MSIVQNSLEHLPVVTAAAGYVAGTVMDIHSQHRIQENRLALTETLGEIGVAAQPNVVKRIGRAAVSITALATAATAGFAGYAWQAEAPAEVQPPIVEIVADASAATAILDGGEPAKQINIFAQAIEDQDSIETEALITRLGTVTIGTVEQISQEAPSGASVMDQATQTAIDQAMKVKSESISGESQKNVGVVVLTNGNSIGAPESIVAKAQLTQTPVYVVNVEQGEGNPQTIEALKSVATQTGGQYWTSAEADPTVAAEQVASNLNSIKTEDKQEKQPNWPMRIASLASLVIGPLAYRRSYKKAFHL